MSCELRVWAMVYRDCFLRRDESRLYGWGICGGSLSNCWSVRSFAKEGPKGRNLETTGRRPSFLGNLLKHESNGEGLRPSLLYCDPSGLLGEF